MVKGFKYIIATAVLIFMGLPLYGVQAGEKVNLRLNLRPGELYPIYVKTFNRVEKVTRGDRIEDKEELGAGYTFKTLEVDRNGRMRVQLNYESVYYKLDSPRGLLVYDSGDSNSVPPPELKAQASFVGKSLSLVFTEEGKVEDVAGTEKLIEAILDDYGVKDEEKRKAIRDSLGKLIGKDAIRRTVEELINIFPGRPVGVGESWQKTRHYTQRGIRMTSKKIFTLKAIEDNVAVISVKTKDVSGDDPVEMAGLTLHYNITGEQSGEIRVDLATGWILSGKLKQQTSGTVTIEENPNIPQGPPPIYIAVNGSIDYSPKRNW
ncbi:MAG: hypothetical protein D6710_09730 [Nitrospirae bacterium]|nr:MAG: hypothetical protein D6710_09730 [Nitrospirota bacterium]